MSFLLKIKYSIANYAKDVLRRLSSVSNKKVKKLLILLVFILSGTSAYAIDTDGDGVDDEFEGFGILSDGTLISDTLGTGVVIDGPAWETVLADLPSSQSFVESFETFNLNTPLDGIAIAGGEFTLSVVSTVNGNVVTRENDVDNTQYGTSPNTGNRQATFQMSGRNTITEINLVFASPVVGFGLYLGDIHDGGDDTRLEILFDEVAVWDSTANVGGNLVGDVTNILTGEVQELGNATFGFIGSYDLVNFVTKVTIRYDNNPDNDNQGGGDNFTIDDISAIFPGRDCDGDGTFDHEQASYSYSGSTCPATLIVNKSWVNANVNDAVEITTAITAGGISNNETLNSIAELATEDTDTQTIALDAGSTVNFSEAFTVGTAGDYTSVLTCTGGDDTNPNDGLDIVVADIDNIIECTYENTRRSAEVTIIKEWINANIGDTVEISTTGAINNADFSPVAGLATETDTDTNTYTVFAGEILNFSETFTAGNAASYTTELACTGTNDANPNDGLLVDVTDTAIICTYTNARVLTDLQIEKSFLPTNPVAGETLTFTLVVTNNGPDDATTIVVDDTILAGFSFIGSSMTGGDNQNQTAPNLQWEIDGLANGASETLTYQAIVQAP